MAVAGYNVYIEGVLRTTVLGTTTRISGLDPGLYHAEVQAFDDSGNYSAHSGSVAFTVPTPETLGDTFPGLALTGPRGQLALDTTGATIQAGEPWDNDRTVWATWVAPADGRYAFDTLLDQTPDAFAQAALSMPNLEGYWRLNEGGFVAVDQSGLDRHGVYLAGHTETPGVLELDAAAALLDGATQSIQLPDAPGLSIGATGLTVVLLVRVDQPATPHPAPGGGTGLVMKAGEWSIGYVSTSASFLPGSFFAGTTALSQSAAFTDADYLDAPTWVMLVATFDPPGSAGGVSLYRGGTLRSFHAYPVDPTRPAPPQPILVGATPGAPLSGFLAGAVSDVAAWSRVLTPDEINQLYTEFAGVQNPPAFLGVVAQGTTTAQGDLVITFTRSLVVGSTLELWVGSEYQDGSNTIFDSRSNDYTRVLRSRNDHRKLAKLVGYRCDVTHAISAGDTLTIRPTSAVGIRAAAVLAFDPLGALDSSALQDDATGQPAASPAVHPTSRDARVVAAAALLGPPGDGYSEDPSWSTQLRIGTVSFDAGIPVTRLRVQAADSPPPSPAGYPAGIVITNPGPLVAAGTTLQLNLAHTYIGAGTQPVTDSAGSTWTSPAGATQADAAHTVRATRYVAVLAADWLTGGTITIAATSALTSYAFILAALTGAAAPTQAASSTGVSSSASLPPLEPDSLAGLASGILAWAGPASDSIGLPLDWEEVAREGNDVVAVLLANPLRRGSHELVWNPDLLTSPRTWISIDWWTGPAAPSGGPLTPHDSNVTLVLSLLGRVPIGADAPWQPVFDATPDPPRQWITIAASNLRP